MAAVTAAQKREASLESALGESRKAYDLSKQQYDVGSIDFQTLLDTRRRMLLVEDTYIQTKNDRLAAAVDLYKALGGGWAEETPGRQTAPAQPAAPAPAPAPAAPSPAPAGNTPAPAPVSPTTL